MIYVYLCQNCRQNHKGTKVMIINRLQFCLTFMPVWVKHLFCLTLLKQIDLFQQKQ